MNISLSEKEIGHPNSRSPKTPAGKNPKRPILRYIKNQTVKIQRQRILKTEWESDLSRVFLLVSSDVSAETLHVRREYDDILKVLKGKGKLATKNILSSKTVLQKWRRYKDLTV